MATAKLDDMDQHNATRHELCTLCSMVAVTEVAGPLAAHTITRALFN